MNSKKAKRLRQLTRHLMNTGKTEQKEWLTYGSMQKYVEIEVPDTEAPTVFGEDGKLIMTMKKQSVATGTVMMDPNCGRAIYQTMKARAIAMDRQS